MFKSTTALKNFVAMTSKVEAETLYYVDLANGEKVLVSKDNPSVPLGFVTVTYQGIVPGRGKVFDVYARPA